jgi:fatty acid desaturase
MIDVANPEEFTRKQVFSEIKKLCEPDYYTNAWVLLREYSVFAVVVGLAIWSKGALEGAGYGIGWWIPIYIASLVVIGVWFQNRLACLVHESSHYSLFKNRIVNDVLGNLFVAFPFFGMISNYRIGHWGHHRHVNDPELDPDLLRLAQHHPRNFPVTKLRFLFEYVLLQLSPHKAYTYLKGRASYVAMTMKHNRQVAHQDPLGKRVSWLLRAGYYGTLAGMLTWFGWWPEYFFYWLLPLVTVYPATLFLREIGHHGNYPDDGDYTNSRVYEGYWFEREVFFPFSEQNHVVHHMFPTIPWKNMRAAHALLMRFPPYRDQVVICDGFFLRSDPQSGRPSVMDIMAAPSGHYARGRSGTGLQPMTGPQRKQADDESLPYVQPVNDASRALRRETIDEVGGADPIESLPQAGES